MKYSAIVAALLLASTAATDLKAQEAPRDNTEQAQSQDDQDRSQDSDSMMNEIGGVMGSGMDGMMRHGRMGHGMRMRGPMMRMIFIMMDTDGDGALSLEEVQAVHARLFKAIDADKNGKVTLEEIQQFLRSR
jgi:EF hand domain-containing protein